MTNEEKLFDLVNGAEDEIQAASRKKELYGDWYELTIGIGNDHTATILIDDESLIKLYGRNMKKRIKDKIIWILKQLLPLRYKSEYAEDGEKCRITWRMWLGKCFHIKNEKIK